MQGYQFGGGGACRDLADIAIVDAAGGAGCHAGWLETAVESAYTEIALAGDSRLVIELDNL